MWKSILLSFTALMIGAVSLIMMIFISFSDDTKLVAWEIHLITLGIIAWLLGCCSAIWIPEERKINRCIRLILLEWGHLYLVLIAIFDLSLNTLSFGILWYILPVIVDSLAYYLGQKYTAKA